MRKLLLTSLVAISMLVSSAALIGSQKIGRSIATAEDSKVVVTRADVIVTKFRMNNGVPQYRHWNETWGYWVEPDWVTLT